MHGAMGGSVVSNFHLKCLLISASPCAWPGAESAAVASIALSAEIAAVLWLIYLQVLCLTLC